MTKKALCVGINDYQAPAPPLKGSVNDAKAWADLLVNHFDFPPENVHLLLDADATKANVMAALKELVTDASSGDVRVFANSSHGTYVADTNGDEEDPYDEAICPYDFKLIVDDELRRLFDGLAKGVHFTVISDSCFSGTVLRLAEDSPDSTDDWRVRSLSPRLLGLRVLMNPRSNEPKRKQTCAESRMKELLLSAASDGEQAWDGPIDGVVEHGAMTYFAIKVIADAGYQITYEDLHARLLLALHDRHISQHPQLEGRTEEKERQVFS